MPTVKVIDAAAWAALPSISLVQGENLATKGILSDTYRLIRDDVSAAVVSQWAGVGVESIGETGGGTVYTTDLTATGIESSGEVGATTETVTSGLITTNLKVQLESDNTTFSASGWDCEVSALSLASLPTATAPSLKVGGMPTGLDYLEFTDNEGLGDQDISLIDIPDGAEARTMYVLARYPNQEASFQGVMYGASTASQAFGFAMNTSEELIADYWGGSAAYTGTTLDDNIWHVICVTYSGTVIKLFVDGVERASESVALNTVLDNYYINEKLNDTGGYSIDVAAAGLVYSDVHDGTQITQMTDYLTTKYITGGYTQKLVNNNTSSTISWAQQGSDSSLLTFSMWFDDTTDVGTRFSLLGLGRASVNFVNDTATIELKDTTATTIYAGTTPGFITPGTLHHLLVVADMGVTPTVKVWVDGTLVTMSDSVSPTTGTLDHTRTTNGLIGSASLQRLGDVFVDTTTAGLTITDFSSGGLPVNISAVGAPKIRMTGPAKNWNTPNNGGSFALTSSGGFTNVV